MTGAPDTVGTPRPVVHLEGSPGLGAAFARALVPSRAKRARLPEHELTIHDFSQDRSRLAAYSRVCGFTLRDAVPPTWIHVLTFPLHVHLLGDADSTIRLAGAVHTSNTMTLHRPVLADEALDLTVHAEGLRPHRRGALVDLVGRAEVDGETVWSGVSTYLAQGMKAPGEPEQVERPSWEAVTPQARWRLSGDLGRRYRAVSGDPNPIHTNRVAAKAFGFPRPIIHGMWTHARALAALEGRLPERFAAGVDFVKPVLLPGTIGFHASTVDGGIVADVTNRDGSKPHLRMRIEET
ncbi:MaoC/PaaZ C-terminal domain-containing protein [uncultured Demequina sp.]|uniref:MaoC/PaaZ C-terminal domain-containing protein n=1 Tax=uncultured Demequina sp. TaxID=693499 RepID=UPI0026010898|nr:MaoC/PaaZ C-terminal domain-containing protein [uncultured Demequina sp.]